MRIDPRGIVGLLAACIMLPPPVTAGGLTKADCDCSQIVGTCMTGEPIITQSHDQGEMFNVRHWSLSLKVEPGQCVLVSTAVSYQKNGELRAGLSNNRHERLLPNGGPGPVVFEGTARESAEELSLTVGAEPGGTQCRLCAVRKEKQKDKSAEKDANDLAKELGLDTGGSGSTSLAAQANQLEGDLARWEDQEQERLRREADERARLAAIEQQRRMDEDIERARLAAEQQAMQAQSPPPVEESGSGWGMLGAIASGVIQGYAQAYIADKGGMAVVPPGLYSQPQTNSGMSPGCESVLPRLQSQLDSCRQAGLRQSGNCLQARARLNCWRQLEPQVSSCSDAVQGLRNFQQQEIEQIRGWCG